MTNILAGARIRAVDRPAAVFDQALTAESNISSTTFVTGSPVVDVTFTAPTSGRVLVTVGAGIRDNAAAGNRGIVAPEIYEGTSAAGTLVVAADDTTRSVVSIDKATDFCHVSRVTMVSGLTPGATHYARTVHRVTAGSTVDIGARNIGLVPVP